MATLHVKPAALPEALRLLAPLLADGRVVVSLDEEEIDLAEAARRLGVDYYTARRIIVVDRKIPYRRKTSGERSPILVKASDIEAYKQSLSVTPRKRRRRTTKSITGDDIRLGLS